MSNPDLMRLLAKERHMREAMEQDLRTLRRDNARLSCTGKSRTHYILYVPKPRWAVIFLTVQSWAACVKRASRRLWSRVHELVWPPVEEGDT